MDQGTADRNLRTDLQAGKSVLTSTLRRPSEGWLRGSEEEKKRGVLRSSDKENGRSGEFFVLPAPRSKMTDVFAFGTERSKNPLPSSKDPCHLRRIAHPISSGRYSDYQSGSKIEESDLRGRRSKIEYGERDYSIFGPEDRRWGILRSSAPKIEEGSFSKMGEGSSKMQGVLRRGKGLRSSYPEEPRTLRLSDPKIERTRSIFDLRSRRSKNSSLRTYLRSSDQRLRRRLPSRSK